MKNMMKTPWCKLTTGEKIGRLVLKVLKYAAIAAIVVAIGSIVIGLALGVFVAVGITNAFIGGFKNASRVNTNKYYGYYKW